MSNNEILVINVELSPYEIGTMTYYVPIVLLNDFEFMEEENIIPTNINNINNRNNTNNINSTDNIENNKTNMYNNNNNNNKETIIGHISDSESDDY